MSSSFSISSFSIRYTSELSIIYSLVKIEDITESGSYIGAEYNHKKMHSNINYLTSIAVHQAVEGVA